MMAIDRGMVYRVMFCHSCGSLRYHRIDRLGIRRINGEVEVYFAKKCSGLPPDRPNKLRRLVTECQHQTKQWLSVGQWNALMGDDLYSTNE